MTLDKWAPFRSDGPGVRCRLFCFHHAGGNAMFYRAWRQLMPPEIDFCPLELPGHGVRIDEPPFKQMSTLVETLCETLQPLLTVQFAVFGHSMGACIAYESARHLQSADGRAAVHLFVSGRSAPDRVRRDPPLRPLRDRDVLAALRRFGGTPPAVMARSELMAALLPTMRADLELIENYAASAGCRVACPITAFAGAADDSIDVRFLEAWSSLTSGAFRLRIFPGGHFYAPEIVRALALEIAQDLGAVVGRGIAQTPPPRT